MIRSCNLHTHRPGLETRTLVPEVRCNGTSHCNTMPPRSTISYPYVTFSLLRHQTHYARDNNEDIFTATCMSKMCIHIILMLKVPRILQYHPSIQALGTWARPLAPMTPGIWTPAEPVLPPPPKGWWWIAQCAKALCRWSEHCQFKHQRPWALEQGP